MSESLLPVNSEAPEPSRWVKWMEAVGAPLTAFINDFGGFWKFTASTLFWLVRPPYRWWLLLEQMDMVGVGTVIIIMLCGVFTGAVFTFQSLFAFRQFGGEDLVGSTVVLSMARELSPAMTVLLFAGRSGSSMATELATMRVTEQIDALETMAVNPLQYLVVPRMVASFIMVPALCMVFTTTAWVGCFWIATEREGLDPGSLMTNTMYHADPPDFGEGLIKSAIYGIFVALISCYQGYTTTGGARGVGRSATSAVVISSVSMVMLNYFVTELLHPLLYAQYNL